DVRHLGVRRNDAIVEATRLELAGDEVGGGARVTRRGRAPASGESPQECDQRVAILLDPRTKLLAIVLAHVGLHCLSATRPSTTLAVFSTTGIPESVFQ